MLSKRMKKKEDRISDLPDAIIQHILSFLPSTEQAIRTGILSKRWQNQWTQVPVLIFINSTGMPFENFIKFIDNTLLRHDCYKINKFHLYLRFLNYTDPEIASKISFATSRGVEDLNLSLSKPNYFSDLYSLPEFFFNNASLVKLRTLNCSFMPNEKVNWRSLTALSIVDCKLADQDIPNILSGSPSLKSLELDRCSLLVKVVVASQSLKRLVLQHCYDNISLLEISCPKLIELSLDHMYTNDPKLFAQAIKSVLSRSSVLESLSIQSIYHGVLVIASQSLKRLVIGNITDVSYIEISCPKLERLKLFKSLDVNDVKLLNLSSSLSATIDFHHSGDLQTQISLITDILNQLQHVNELKLGTWFISILSKIKVGDGFSPWLSIKCLTLHTPHLKEHHSGIAHLLHISHVLEKLVIHVPPNHKCNQRVSGNNYWISNATVFDCLISHLKTIKIISFQFLKEDVRHQPMLNFVQFLLNNAKVLERMVVIVKDDDKGRFPPEVSQELLSLPRCSQNAIIEFQCFKEIGKLF